MTHTKTVNQTESLDRTMGNAKLSHIFDIPGGKFNNTVKLSDFDKSVNAKVYCKEAYAQSAYDMYNRSEKGEDIACKDLIIGETYKGTIISYNIVSGLLYCEESKSRTTVIIPLNEYGDPAEIVKDQIVDFMLIRESNGTLYGSVKRHNNIQYAEDVETFRQENKWFEVKLMELIRGGYIALYKNTVKCFVPGAHAAANVIHDFDSLIGKKINVMVDNYDWASKLYIVSHKKYIKHSLPTKVLELEFDKKYTGILTSAPTKYGIFVELEGYFTGLIHSAEFKDYENVCKTYKPGDTIECFVKNVFDKNGAYRIILTMNENDIDPAKVAWTKVKRKVEGQLMDYTYDTENDKFILIDSATGEQFSLNVPYESIKDNLDKKKIKVYEVCVLNQNIRFEFA